jgi:hypothetical protein
MPLAFIIRLMMSGQPLEIFTNSEAFLYLDISKMAANVAKTVPKMDVKKKCVLPCVGPVFLRIMILMSITWFVGSRKPLVTFTNS